MSLLDNVKEEIKDELNSGWDNIVDKVKEMLLSLAGDLEELSNRFLDELINFVLYTPTVSEDPIILKLWTIVRLISFSLIGMIFVWEAFKKFFSADNIMANVEFKTMLVRMIYGLILAVFSLDIIDLMINFNQAIIETIKINFTIELSQQLTITTVFGFVMTFALLIVQIVLALKLILQYWMRIAEIWLMAIIGPALYVLWINPNWGGYLKQWVSRLISTIGTTLIWAILFAIYSAMVSLVASTGMLVGFPTLGPIAGICLSVALLLTMHQTPGFLRSFMNTHDSALDIMKKTTSSVVSTYKAPVNFAKKATGWIKKK